MEHCENQKLAEELACFLKKLGSVKDKAGLRKQATRLLSNITSDDIARAERNLMQNGFTLKKIQELSSAFITIGLMGNGGIDLCSRLPDHHILRKVMAEHEMQRCFLADLEDVVTQIQQAPHLTPASGEFMRLGHIIEHLNSLQEHQDREDDVLFPAMREQGWKSLFDHIENQHTYIQIAVDDLIKLTAAFDKMPLASFKIRLSSTVRCLCPLLRDHMAYEDRVLFPLAVTMIENGSVWERLRQVCNQIDYCGIHL
ncbi:MAG: DUF438 domain-containing protein [Planctomycetales bacterium]|nr:DUF438 domain-containing protein [Planctomycetales bacterium]